MNELLTAALGYAEHKSWRVFPVGDDKRPLVKWKESASRDPRMIREWWRRYPEAGIGFAIPEGVLVVDVDPRNGGVLPDGLPATRTSRTRSDGTHAYFVVPAALTFVGHLAPGVDLKAGGKGYVILPPTPGYTWARTGAMASLPDDVLVTITRDAPSFAQCEVESPPRYVPWESGTAYGLKALENQAARVVAALNGERNNVLFAAAAGIAALVAGGELSQEHAEKWLYNAALEAGLDQLEVVNTLRSAFEHGMRNPRRASGESA